MNWNPAEGQDMVKSIGGINRFGRARLGMEVDTLEAYIHIHVSMGLRNGR